MYSHITYACRTQSRTHSLGTTLPYGLVAREGHHPTAAHTNTIRRVYNADAILDMTFSTSEYVPQIKSKPFRTHRARPRTRESMRGRKAHEEHPRENCRQILLEYSRIHRTRTYARTRHHNRSIDGCQNATGQASICIHTHALALFTSCYTAV